MNPGTQQVPAMLENLAFISLSRGGVSGDWRNIHWIQKPTHKENQPEEGTP
jgi:hypothetical protein